MPPWNPVNTNHQYKGDRQLTNQEGAGWRSVLETAETRKVHTEFAWRLWAFPDPAAHRTFANDLYVFVTRKAAWSLGCAPYQTSAAIAQMGERQTEDLKVDGSIRGLGTLSMWMPVFCGRQCFNILLEACAPAQLA